MIYINFLYILPLIVIPILIHLFSLKRFEKMDFSSLQFLLEENPRLKRWIRIRELLLLLTRISLILLLVFAGGLKLISFRFPVNTSLPTILDTSASMEGRTHQKKYISTFNKCGIADMNKTLGLYKKGKLISDFQKISFNEILKQKKKFPLITPQIVNLPSTNTGVRKVLVSPSFDKKKTNITVLIYHKGIGEKKNIDIKVDGISVAKLTKFISPGRGEIEISATFNKGAHYGDVLIQPGDSIPFDDIRFFSFQTLPNASFAIYADSFPVILSKAMNKKYFISEWKEEVVPSSGKNFCIITDFSKSISYFFIKHFYKGGIISITDHTDLPPGLEAKKISPVYAKITNGKGNFSGILPFIKEIPIKYKYRIAGGDVLLRFSDFEPAAVKYQNYIFLPFSLENNELIYHTSYIPFFFYLVSEILSPFGPQNKNLNDTIVAKNGIVTDPEGMKFKLDFSNDSLYILQKRGIYTIESEGKMYYIAVNPCDGEYNLEVLKKSEFNSVFGSVKRYDGTSFFLFVFLVFLLIETLLERGKNVR